LNKTNKKITTFLSLLLLSSATLLSSGQKKANLQKPARQAQTILFNGHHYDVFSAAYPHDKIRFYWKNDQNEKLISIARLKAFVEEKGHKLLFATNAGMFTTENSPKGLYIENGHQLVSLDTKVRKNANFYMQPNGVFLLTKTEAKVVTTSGYGACKGKAVFATQSGPMLVINGEINSNFTKGSANINIRSGVGISPKGMVIFAISDEWVNFYDFATFFRDTLKCSNALFLDGAISKMYLPGINRMETDGYFGAMITVEE